MCVDIEHLQSVYREVAENLGYMQRLHEFAVDAYGGEHVSDIVNDDDDVFFGSDDDAFKTWHFNVSLGDLVVSPWVALRDESGEVYEVESTFGVYVSGDFRHAVSFDDMKGMLRHALFEEGE